jgi:hypothetical protein
VWEVERYVPVFVRGGERGEVRGLIDGVDRYMELLKDSRVRGYLWDQQNYVVKES